MASSSFDRADYQRAGSPYDEPPRERGCFFYGCIIAIALALLFAIAVGVIFFLFYRWVGGLVEEYTATAPRQLPVVQMPAERRTTLNERVEAFKAALRERRPTGPLELTSDDLNALIEDHPKANLKGKVYVTIEDDQLKGQVSLPLSDIPSLGLTRGRYLNGEAEFNVRLEDGEPFLTIRSLEVNGKRPSEQFLRSFKGQNLLKDVEFDPDTRKLFHRLDNVQVKDGKLIITPREPGKMPESGRPGTTDREGKADAKSASSPSEKSSTGPNGPARLPEDVLAPPGSRPAPSGDPSGTP